ncbi:hypothetical protein HK099_002710 [Clydaea vesicula]|uniref:Phosphofructokinase domain-containing protein n=1 Tax=Clydaea vesicula TaxID=447962 RepID=A0AAD5U2G0_9FUNG|nr:hypothetical protein HK099_002710 [Clydaea vesicula]
MVNLNNSVHLKATDKVNPLQKEWEIKTLGSCEFSSSITANSFVQEERILLHTTFNTATNQLIDTPLESLEKAGPRAKLYFDGENTTIGIVTCGGICPAVNNVIRSLVNTASYKYNVKKIVGFKYGYEGLNPETSEWTILTPADVKDIHTFGGSLLGTSRGPQDVKVMVDYLQKMEINILFTIGGDGTQKGSLEISKEAERRGYKLSVVGVPKTIDNDISYVEKCFGFETAVALSQQPLRAAHEEARSAKFGIGIVKLMGRLSGFIALSAALASGDVNLLLLPEMKFTMDDVTNYLIQRFKKRSHCLILVSEGAGQDLCTIEEENGPKTDKSGNVVLKDIGLFLKDEIKNRLKKFGISPTIKYIDPSYTIRSSAPIANDAVFALQLGQMAVHAAMAVTYDH